MVRQMVRQLIDKACAAKASILFWDIRQCFSDAVKRTGILLALLLAACSSDPNLRKQVSDDEAYLKTEALDPMTAPQGVILPVQRGDYELPSVRHEGAIGKALNILPPTQSLPPTGAQNKTTQPAESSNSTADRLVVQSGSDNTGLPVVIVRTPYDNLWDRLPGALHTIGIEISDSSKAQGKMEIKYSNPGDSFWSSLKVPAPSLKEDNYKVQLGDLENRSSLQFINSRGQVLTLSENDSMVKVLESVLNQPKSKK